jgi:dipeptidase D
LFTVDEEAGMGGARAGGDALAGRLMLNLDTEAWGEFYLGCAGGLDVNVRRSGIARAGAGRLAVLADRSARSARRA